MMSQEGHCNNRIIMGQRLLPLTSTRHIGNTCKLAGESCASGKPRSPHFSLHVKPKCEAEIVKVSGKNCEGGTSQRWTLRWRERTSCVQNTNCVHVYTLPHCMHHREAAWNGQIRVYVVAERIPVSRDQSQGCMQHQTRAICADVDLINAAWRKGRPRSTGWYLRRMRSQIEARGGGCIDNIVVAVHRAVVCATCSVIRANEFICNSLSGRRRRRWLRLDSCRGNCRPAFRYRHCRQR